MTIPATELAQLRAIADDWLPDTCTVQVPTATVDALGGVSVSFASTYTGVACRIDPASDGNEQVKNYALEGRTLYAASFKYDATLSTTYRVIHSGITYEIVSIIENNSMLTLKRALLVRLN
jgi:hypothetical protein